MKNFFNLRGEIQELTEGKVSMAKLKVGMKVSVIHKGRSAKNYGVDGQDVYGGKVQVLGMGIVPFGKKAEKRHVVAKDYKDAQSKYKEIWDTEEIRYGQFWNAQGRMKAFFSAIADKDRKFKPGHVCWIWQVLEGENKGLISYCFISMDDTWEVVFLNKATEFILET